MRPTLAVLAVLVLSAACSPARTYSRSTLAPLADAYACAAFQLGELGYSVELEDPVGGLLQARREITGIVETARRGAARATQLITLGVAGGGGTRFDELTISVHRRQYPQGNTIQATAGMLTVAGEVSERARPTDGARADARALIDACAPRF
jgi:hypothetical protein